MVATVEERLGKVVYRAKTARMSAIFLVALGVMFLAMGRSFLAGDPDTGGGDPIVGAFCLVIGAVPIAFGVWYLSRRFCWYERGIASSSIFGRSALLFSDMDRIRYNATQQYVNGVFTGTAISMTLAGPRSSVSFSSNTTGAETENLEGLRDQASLALSDRLYQHLMDGGLIEWTPRVKLGREGFRFLTKGEESFIPFSPNVLSGFEAGMFYLWLEREKQSLLEMSCGDVNFWPGLVVFRRLQEEASS